MSVHTLESFKHIKNLNETRVIIALDGNENLELEEKYNIYKYKLRTWIKDKPNYELICHEKKHN